MKRLLSRLLPLALSLAAALPAQTLQDDLWLGGTNNRLVDDAVLFLKSGSQVIAESGATVDLSDATLILDDDQIPQAKVNGLVTDLAAKQPLDSDLSAIAALSTTSFGRATLSLADAAAGRSYFGLVIGTDVQSFDADLSALGALSSTGFSVRTASNTWAQRTITGSGLATLTNGNGVSGNPVVTVPKASAATVIAGTNDTDAVTPLGDKAALDARLAAWLRDAGYPYSDGVTSDRGIWRTPGPRGAIAGAPVIEIIGLLHVPSVQATSPGAMPLWIGPAAAAPWVATGESLFMSFPEFSNDFAIAENTTGYAEYRSFFAPGFRTLYAGKFIWLRVKLTKGTGNPQVWVDGADVSSLFTVINSASPPEWLSTNLVTTYYRSAFTWPAGVGNDLAVVLGSLTDAEAESWRVTGMPPVWVGAGAYASSVAVDDFSVGFGSGSVSGQSATGATFTSATGSFQGLKSGGFVVRPRQRFLATFNLVRNSGVLPDIMIIGVPGAGNDTENYSASLVEGDNSVLFEIIGGVVRTSFFSLYNNDNGAADYTISNFKIVPEGAISLPRFQAGIVVGDASGLGDNPGRCYGFRQITSRKDFQFTVNSSTSGNEQLLGGEILDTSVDVLDAIEQEPVTGTPTTSIGSASAGAQYKTSAALSAGINPVTLVTRKTASNNLWVSSDSTDTVRTTVKGHRR